MVSVGRLFGGGRRGRRRGVVTLIPSWQLVRTAVPPAPVPPLKLPTRRKWAILHAYVLATGGRLPTDLEKLLADMRELMGEVSEAEVREAIKRTLRDARRQGALLERKLRAGGGWPAWS